MKQQRDSSADQALPVVDGWPVVLDSLLDAAEQSVRRKDALTKITPALSVREFIWIIKELRRRRAADNQ